ncbi:MAG: hypothetical protein U5R31_17355 [Acidimicrobiia bacterium]|nr:hypothetical protein [Acidimicrobiia bacterium]
MRVGAHDGFDRVVLELSGDDPPEYRVRRVEAPVREDGSGRTVAVEGQEFLEVRLAPASGVDLSDGDVTETYTGPNRLTLGRGPCRRGGRRGG